MIFWRFFDFLKFSSGLKAFCDQTYWILKALKSEEDWKKFEKSQEHKIFVYVVFFEKTIIVILKTIFDDVLQIVPLTETTTSFSEPNPSATDKLKQTARSQFEKLNIKGKVGTLINRAFAVSNTTLKQTGGRQLDYPEVKATTQVQ